MPRRRPGPKSAGASPWPGARAALRDRGAEAPAGPGARASRQRPFSGLGRLPRMLRILPSRERVEEELLEIAWREGVSLGGALALPELVALLAPREPVDALAQRAIFEGCARGVDLGPFHAVRGRTGFAAAALEAIAALKAGRCGSKELNALAERAQGSRSGRLEAIARLYAAYERALSGRSADDPSDRLSRAVARLDDRRAPLPPV